MVRTPGRSACRCRLASTRFPMWRSIRRVHAAIGRPVDVEFLERDLWAAHRLIADRYRDRRAFLAGDACHLHPPFGGYGMNLGIADGVDLGWKLGAVLAGWGSEALLASYESETPAGASADDRGGDRKLSYSERPVAEAESRRRYSRGSAARVPRSSARSGLAKTREFKTLGVVLGSRYEDSPIVIADGARRPSSITQTTSHPRTPVVSRHTHGSMTAARSMTISDRLSACCCSKIRVPTLRKSLPPQPMQQACLSRFSICDVQRWPDFMPRRSR